MTPRVVTIASIVEGHGDVFALPKLLHRLAKGFPMVDLRTPKPPWRRSRGSLVAAGGIEREVESNSWVGPSGGVLVLLDADDDCPAELAPAPLNRAQATRQTGACPWFWPSVNSKRGSSPPLNPSPEVSVFWLTWRLPLTRRECGAPKSG